MYYLQLLRLVELFPDYANTSDIFRKVKRIHKKVLYFCMKIDTRTLYAFCINPRFVVVQMQIPSGAEKPAPKGIYRYKRVSYSSIYYLLC